MDLTQFFKVLNGLGHIEWKRSPKNVFQGDKYGPAARNLRKVEIFRREPADICTSRNEYITLKMN